MSEPPLASALVLAALLAGPAALATQSGPPVGEVEELINEANRLRYSGDDQGALPLLVRAYQIDPKPRTAVQLGLVETALGRWADADRHLTEGLKAGGDPFIQKNRDVIVESLRNAKLKVGSLEINGDPPGAEVLVNGVPVGTLPLSTPVRVNAGTADVEVRATGFQAHARSVAVPAQHLQSIVIRLAPLVVATGQGAGGGVPEPVGGPDPAGTDLLEREAAARPERSRAAWWWIRMGATAAALGSAALGAYGFLSHEQKVGAFRDKTDPANRPRCFERGNAVVDADGKPAGSDCVALRSEYEQARTVTMAGAVGAGVSSALAIVLWIVRPDDPPTRAAVGASPRGLSVAVGSAGVQTAYRFAF